MLAPTTVVGDGGGSHRRQGQVQAQQLPAGVSRRSGRLPRGLSPAVSSNRPSHRRKRRGRRRRRQRLPRLPRLPRQGLRLRITTQGRVPRQVARPELLGRHVGVRGLAHVGGGRRRVEKVSNSQLDQRQKGHPRRSRRTRQVRR